MKAVFAAAFCALSVVLAAGSTWAEEPEALTSDPALLAFFDDLAAATLAFNTGDPEPYGALLTEDFVLMGGAGGVVIGRDEFQAAVSAIAQGRGQGSEVVIDYLAIRVDGDVAYTVQTERRDIVVQGQEERAQDALRVSHVLRREDGVWKLALRHADAAVERRIPGQPPAQESQ